MRTIRIMPLLPVMLLLGGPPETGSDPAGVIEASRRREGLTVVSFNIRYDNPGDGENAWPKRRDRVIALLRSFEADLIGLQEVLPGQRRDLEVALGRTTDETGKPGTGYVFRGVGRDDGVNRGEQSPVLYRADRFEEVAWGTWWLSETPDKPSRGWDAALNRVATWVRLKDRVTGQSLLAVSTHFDHRGEQARLESARWLASRLADEPRVVLLGDFNARPGSPPHLALTTVEAREDATTRALRDAAGDDASPTWCDWDGEPDDGMRIDWILLRGYEVERYQVPAWSDRTRPESDHLPVAARLRPE